MKTIQREFSLPAMPRGFHLVTQLIEKEVPELREIEHGVLHVFIKHTSASLTLNENADPTVREDFEAHFNRAVPEDTALYAHHAEGPDDMPAHLKASTLGSSVTVPITSGRLALGTWQGIYLCEHRDRSKPRRIVATAIGS